MDRASPLTCRRLFAALSLVSILALLSHLHAVLALSKFALFLGVPIVLAMVMMVRRCTDRDFRARLTAGWVGGLIGTFGYDLVRLPFHDLGHNPFGPIRVYGVWLLGADQSTVFSDLAGFLYHLSNGVTFGWIYAMLAGRRSWGWAVLYALLLEALAVVSVFGEVFLIRGAYSALAIAFGAHLFYGIPLGWISERPERGRRLVWLAVALAVGSSIGFLFLWQPIRSSVDVGDRQVVVGPDALYPGWIDMEVGERVEIIFLSDRDHVQMRTPGSRETISFNRSRSTWTPESPGLYQVWVPGEDFRSIMISVRREGDYRPVRPSR